MRAQHRANVDDLTATATLVGAHHAHRLALDDGQGEHIHVEHLPPRVGAARGQWRPVREPGVVHHNVKAAIEFVVDQLKHSQDLLLLRDIALDRCKRALAVGLRNLDGQFVELVGSNNLIIWLVSLFKLYIFLTCSRLRPQPTTCRS